MKVKVSFVTNSSSSNFLIAIKNGVTNEELIEKAGWLSVLAEDLLEAISEFEFSDNVINLIDKRIEEDYGEEQINNPKIRKEYDWLVEMVKKHKVTDDWDLAEVDFGYNYGNSVGEALANLRPDIDTEYIKFISIE